MSLRFALQVIGLLTVGYLLLASLLAMGPIGWVIVVPMLVIGATQVHRNRKQRRSAAGTPNYCPSCGSAIEFEARDADATGDDGRDGAIRYCPDCGAGLRSRDDAGGSDESSDGDREVGSTNCPDCGAPNDADLTTCEYCDAKL